MNQSTSKMILGLDLGTTGNRAILFNQQGQLISQLYQELRELQKIKSPKNPHPQGWGYTDEARLRGLNRVLLGAIASNLDDLFVGIPLDNNPVVIVRGRQTRYPKIQWVGSGPLLNPSLDQEKLRGSRLNRLNSADFSGR
jgi:glycerol kinase